MQSILLVPCSLLPGEDINVLAQPFREIFHLPVTPAPKPDFDPERAFDPSRNQYWSSALLSLMLEEYQGHAGKILAVTSSDLFVPVLTFVFGEAQLDGRAAIISSHRLKEEFYGLPEDRKLFRERLIKEGVHEIGHTFGLVHCPDSHCVMYSSTAVEEIDLKSEEFCQRCVLLLREKTAPAAAEAARSEDYSRSPSPGFLNPRSLG